MLFRCLTQTLVCLKFFQYLTTCRFCWSITILYEIINVWIINVYILYTLKMYVCIRNWLYMMFLFICFFFVPCSKFRLSYYPHRVESFKEILRASFFGKCQHNVYGDFKQYTPGQGEAPCYFIHVVKKTI